MFSDAYHDEDDDEDNDQVDTRKSSKRASAAKTKPQQQRQQQQQHSSGDHKTEDEQNEENDGADDDNDEEEDEDEHTIHVDEARMTPAERMAHARAATMSEHHGADAMEYMHHTTVMARRIKEVWGSRKICAELYF